MKIKEIKKMDEKEREKKIKELKLELLKAEASLSKGGHSRIREIKRLIARIITLNKTKEELKNNGDMPKVRPA